jgi:hypothetical protein
MDENISSLWKREHKTQHKTRMKIFEAEFHTYNT